MKSNLRAFAIGILLATGVMGATYAIVNEGTNLIGEEEVKAYAIENNLHLLSNEEYEQLLPEIDEEVEKEAEETKENTTDKTTEKADDKSNKSEEKADEVKEEEKEKEEKKEKEENKSFNVEIPDGMATSEVSELLEDKGVIDSANGFDKYLEDLDIATKVRAGTFKMKKNMTYKEAANVLVR